MAEGVEELGYKRKSGLCCRHVRLPPNNGPSRGNVRFTPRCRHSGGVAEGPFLTHSGSGLCPRKQRIAHTLTLRAELVKISAKIVRHGRYVTFQLAEVAVSRDLILENPEPDR